MNSNEVMDFTICEEILNPSNPGIEKEYVTQLNHQTSHPTFEVDF